jgi:hypothetical protein
VAAGLWVLAPAHALGLNDLSAVDASKGLKLTLQMNRAAEAAVPLSKKLLTQSIQTMSVQDAKGILQGGDNSVTQFFVDKTRAPLTTEFMPTVKESLSKLGVVNQFNVIRQAVGHGPGVQRQGEFGGPCHRQNLVRSLFHDR